MSINNKDLDLQNDFFKIKSFNSIIQGLKGSVMDNKEKLHYINTKNDESISIFPEYVENFLQDLFNKVGLSDEQKNIILNSMYEFETNNIANQQQLDKFNQDNLALQIKKIWGDKFNSNMSLINRAIIWLGLDNLLLDNNSLITFLHKMIELGEILLEDQGVKGENSEFILTKEEAKKQRNLLSGDKQFMEALSNKSHPMHKDALSKIQNLNKIIIS